MKITVKTFTGSRKALLLTAGGFAVAGLLSLFVLMQVTSRSRFCGTCHYMQPYYQQWKTSSHNKVPCIKCHIEPGVKNKMAQKMEAFHEVVSMATGKYPARPHAEVKDGVCLRPGCHEKRLLEGKVLLKNGVQFDHTPHLTQERRGRHLHCTSCHAQMVMGKHMAVTNEVCFLCHFKDRVEGVRPVGADFCQKCHKTIKEDITIRNTDAAFSHADNVKPGNVCQDCHIDVVQGRGEVPEIMCTRCHVEPERMKRFDDHVFMHENHVTNHNVECYQCHLQVRHQLYPKAHGNAALGGCGQCHGSAHLAAGRLYRGEGGSVNGEPSAMFTAQVDCIGCHRKDGSDSLILAAFNAKADVSRCVACHDEDAASYLTDWKKEVGEELSKTASALSRAGAAGAKAPEAKRLLEEVQRDFDFVREANGVHNPEYAVTLLRLCREKLEKGPRGR